MRGFKSFSGLERFFFVNRNSVSIKMIWTLGVFKLFELINNYVDFRSNLTDTHILPSVFIKISFTISFFMNFNLF